MFYTERLAYGIETSFGSMSPMLHRDHSWSQKRTILFTVHFFVDKICSPNRQHPIRGIDLDLTGTREYYLIILASYKDVLKYPCGSSRDGGVFGVQPQN